MNKQDIAERAYINGYKKGVEDFAQKLNREYELYYDEDETFIGCLRKEISEIVKELTEVSYAVE